jgi:hypothetical protein
MASVIKPHYFEDIDEQVAALNEQVEAIRTVFGDGDLPVVDVLHDAARHFRFLAGVLHDVESA